uniref:DM domain-containing protein n=1 Tax=Globodera rostochiensis TaxID=31243 RepID=A0A914IFX1_GLORO
MECGECAGERSRRVQRVCRGKKQTGAESVHGRQAKHGTPVTADRRQPCTQTLCVSGLRTLCTRSAFLPLPTHTHTHTSDAQMIDCRMELLQLDSSASSSSSSFTSSSSSSATSSADGWSTRVEVQLESGHGKDGGQAVQLESGHGKGGGKQFSLRVGMGRVGASSSLERCGGKQFSSRPGMGKVGASSSLERWGQAVQLETGHGKGGGKQFSSRPGMGKVERGKQFSLRAGMGKMVGKQFSLRPGMGRVGEGKQFSSRMGMGRAVAWVLAFLESRECENWRVGRNVFFFPFCCCWCCCCLVAWMDHRSPIFKCPRRGNGGEQQQQQQQQNNATSPRALLLLLQQHRGEASSSSAASAVFRPPRSPDVDILSFTPAPSGVAIAQHSPPSLSSASYASSAASSCSEQLEKKYFCQRCLNHAEEHPRKGHKPFCRYRECQCIECQMVEQRRVLNNALNPRKATGESANKKGGAGGSLLGPKPRDPKCARCSAHGEQSALRGHKKALCPFLECACAKCALVEQRRRLMADQIKLRRQQKKARIQTHHHQLNIGAGGVDHRMEGAEDGRATNGSACGGGDGKSPSPQQQQLRIPMTMLLKKAFKKKPSPHQPSSISPLTKTALRNGHAELQHQQQQKNRMLLFQPPPLPTNNNGMFVPTTTAAADQHRRIVQSQLVVTSSASQRNGALLHQAPPIGANGCPPVSSNASLNALQLAVLLRNQQQQQALSAEFAAPPPGFLLHLPHPHAQHSSPPASQMLLPPVPSQSQQQQQQQQQHQSPLPSPAALMGYFGTPPTDNKVMTPPDGASQLCPLLPSPTSTVAPTLPNIQQQQQQNLATNLAPMFPAMARMETMLATALLGAIGNNNGTVLVPQQQQLQFVEDVVKQQMPFDAPSAPALLPNPKPINPMDFERLLLQAIALQKQKQQQLEQSQHQTTHQQMLAAAAAAAPMLGNATTLSQHLASVAALPASVSAATADAVAAAVKTEEHFRLKSCASSDNNSGNGAAGGGGGGGNFLFSINSILRDSLLQAATFSGSTNGMP